MGCKCVGHLFMFPHCIITWWYFTCNFIWDGVLLIYTHYKYFISDNTFVDFIKKEEEEEVQKEG